VLGLPSVNERPIDPPDRILFLGRAWYQNDPIGLDALLLTPCQGALNLTTLIDQSTAEAIPRRPALAISEFDQPALAGEYSRELSVKVFAGHRALHTFDDG